MSLWRLEWLRLTRTHRWIGLAAVFCCLGAAGPVITRNLASIVKSAGGNSNIQVIVKQHTAIDGINAYLGYVQQIGILVIVLIAAAALAFDSRPESAAFLRTRATSRQTIIPKATVAVAAAAAAAYILDTLVAWYEADVLLGHLPVGRTLAAGLRSRCRGLRRLRRIHPDDLPPCWVYGRVWISMSTRQRRDPVAGSAC
jgi:ABC-2 type transport system permease protein